MKTMIVKLAATILILSSCSTVSSSYHYTMGTECLNKGQLIEAKEHFEKSLESWDGHVDALNNLGVTYMALGEIENAWPCYRKASPQSNLAKINLVDCFDKLAVKNNLSNNPTKAEMIQVYGLPDNDQNEDVFRYGSLKIHFKDGKANMVVLTR